MDKKQNEKYRNDYNAEHYARISAIIPKERKSVIEAHYTAQGYKGMSEYINALIDRDMKGE